jgi:hypothetical protein
MFLRISKIHDEKILHLPFTMALVWKLHQMAFELRYRLSGRVIAHHNI